VTRSARSAWSCAAVELFLRNGYHGTSVDAIASVLGVSKQFVYYQFKDKRAILNGVCRCGEFTKFIRSLNVLIGT
jgi:TetR/AcrR family transcriptional regulator, mexJK operon transcriptional repressor